MSLFWRHTGRQTANVWASWPQAWYWRPRELSSTLFLKSFWSDLIFTLSLSLLCSSSRSGYSPHCLINLHLDLVKVSLRFSISQLLSNKSTSHWWKKKDAVNWAFLMHFFLINCLSIYFFFVDIYKKSTRISNGTYIPLSQIRMDFMHIKICSLIVFGKALSLIYLLFDILKLMTWIEVTLLIHWV